MGHIARQVLETPVSLGFICYLLIVVPIMGIWYVHNNHKTSHESQWSCLVCNYTIGMWTCIHIVLCRLYTSYVFLWNEWWATWRI